MPITDEKIGEVAQFCNEHLALKQPILSKSYYYQSLPICVIDAVFSIGVRYSGVEKVVDNFCSYIKIKKFRDRGSNFPEVKDQYSVNEFINDYSQVDSADLANNVFKSRQRTSSRGGILKADAAKQWMHVLSRYSIDNFQDLNTKLGLEAGELDGLEQDIRLIRGQGSGISLGYFYMLAGRDNFIKPDRMIMRFLRNRFGNDRISVADAANLIDALVKRLRRDYTYHDLTVRDLDHAIWNFQRSRP
ncbi:hypothetical protein ACWKW6_34150 [Dyadobacter jiangsuensis]